MYGNIREDTNEALEALLGSVYEAFARFQNLKMMHQRGQKRAPPNSTRQKEGERGGLTRD